MMLHKIISYPICRHQVSMALIKMIKSVFHPPNNFKIEDKNQRVVFTSGLVIG